MCILRSYRVRSSPSLRRQIYFEHFEQSMVNPNVDAECSQILFYSVTAKLRKVLWRMLDTNIESRLKAMCSPHFVVLLANPLVLKC